VRAEGSQRQLLESLARAGVDFVVIGGHAVAAHGFERGTRDVDIVFSTERTSCERLAATLDELDASISIADTPPPEGKITAPRDQEDLAELEAIRGEGGGTKEE
jgi:hypothetical protein